MRPPLPRIQEVLLCRLQLFSPALSLLGSLPPARDGGGVAGWALLNPRGRFVIFMANSRGTYLTIIPVSSLGTVQKLSYI